MRLFDIRPSYQTISPKVTNLVAMPGFIESFKWLMDILNLHLSICKMERVSPTTLSITFNDGHQPLHVNQVLDVVYTIAQYYPNDTMRLLEDGLDIFLGKVILRVAYPPESTRLIADIVFKNFLDYEVRYANDHNEPCDLFLNDKFLGDADWRLKDQFTKIESSFFRPLIGGKKRKLLEKIQTAKELRLEWKSVEERRRRYTDDYNAFLALEKLSDTSLQTGLDLIQTVESVKKDEINIRSKILKLLDDISTDSD